MTPIVQYHDRETVTWMRGSICHPFVDNARKLISFLWILTNVRLTKLFAILLRLIMLQLLVVCFIFAAIAVAASDDCTTAVGRKCSHAFGFYAIYAMFTTLVLCIGGTRVMRRVSIRHIHVQFALYVANLILVSTEILSSWACFWGFLA